ncbi:MAG: hypothetical protein R3A78_15105 [Polyangiales bacterium]
MPRGSPNSGWLPDLSVGFHMEFDGDYWETGPEIMGSLPVFDRNQGDVLEHESELEAARARYVAAATRVRAVVRAVRNRAVSVGARAREYRDAILPIRKRVLTETIRQYNAMQLSVFKPSTHAVSRVASKWRISTRFASTGIHVQRSTSPSRGARPMSNFAVRR